MAKKNTNQNKENKTKQKDLKWYNNQPLPNWLPADVLGLQSPESMRDHVLLTWNSGN